jgi:hypothetical protein
MNNKMRMDNKMPQDVFDKFRTDLANNKMILETKIVMGHSQVFGHRLCWTQPFDMAANV